MLAVEGTVQEVADGALTRRPTARQRRVIGRVHPAPMTNDVEIMIRAAIGGDAGSMRALADGAAGGGDARALCLGAILARDPARLKMALAAASTSRDRQVVAIAAVFLDGDAARVRLLARDHLADHPDSLVVAWIAAGGGGSPSTS